MAGVELRPRTTSEIIDAAIDLVRGHYLAYVMIAAIVTAPAIAYAQLRFDVIVRGVSMDMNWEPAILSFLVSLAFGQLSETVSIAAMSRAYLDEPFDVGGAFLLTARRIVPLVFAWLLRIAAMFLGGLALFVPGIYFGIRTYCLSAVAVLEPERSSPFKIFGRSWRLSEQGDMAIFLAALLSFVLIMVGVVAGGLLAAGLGAAVPALHGPRMRQLIQSALMCFVAPISGAVVTVLYYDQRIRREGFDLERGSQALAPESPPA